jgi:hypothetical protein
MKTFIYSILAVVALCLSGCARPSPVEEKSVLAAQEKTKQAEQITEQMKMYYTARAPEASALAAIAAEGGKASIVAAAGVSSAAPPGAVFAPAPPQAAPAPAPPKKEVLVTPDSPDPVCSWAPVGVVCPK